MTMPYLFYLRNNEIIPFFWFLLTNKIKGEPKHGIKLPAPKVKTVIATDRPAFNEWAKEINRWNDDILKCKN